jgi:peptide/nickel transport system substrate-binding protein
MSMAIDRALLVEIGYGQAGRVTCNWVPARALLPPTPTTCLTQDIDGRQRAAGCGGDRRHRWRRGPRKGRHAAARSLPDLDQRRPSGLSGADQAWWSQLGIESELRNIDASVFFGGDPASPDTFQKFYADMEMYANNFDGTDPQSYLGNMLCVNAPTPDTQWQGENIRRLCSSV